MRQRWDNPKGATLLASPRAPELASTAMWRTPATSLLAALSARGRLWYIGPRMPHENAKDSAILGEEEVQRVAKLARLDLTGDEVRRMTAELSAIVGYVRKLEELDTTDVEPTAHVRLAHTALRGDEPRAGLSHDAALAEAPRVAEEGFAVPAFVDD